MNSTHPSAFEFFSRGLYFVSRTTPVPSEFMT
jgi:hypothetical protein